jgi:hypothetical protein
MLVAVVFFLSLMPAMARDDVRGHALQDSSKADPEEHARRETGKPSEMPDMRRVQDDLKRQRERTLAELKKTDPKAYEQVRKSLRRQEEIGNILEKARRKEISEFEARESLRPLMTNDRKSWEEDIGKCVVRAEKKLEFLRKIQDDPELMVERQIDMLLGQRGRYDEGEDLMLDRFCDNPAGMITSSIPPPDPGRLGQKGGARQ